MAVSAVSSATTTIGKLSTEEVKYLWGVKEEVDRLQSELRWMKAFLSSKDAKVREDDDGRIQEWVAEIRELAYDAENVVESYALKIKSKRKGGFFNVIIKLACILEELWTLWLLHQTRSKIEKIIARITDLNRRLNTYGIKELTNDHGSSASNQRRELRQSYPFIEEDNIVGLTNEIEEVVTLLTKDRQCRVVSICGMGGLGKTTLAKKVFNHDDVRKEFDHFAWVYVSQQFQTRKVWEQILSNFKGPDGEHMKKSDADVTQELWNFLKDNKCLVILDDVWNPQDWNLLNHAFQFKDSQSKILLTSRNKEVAEAAEAANDERSCRIHDLKVLNEDDSWNLFRKIAFRNISQDSRDYSKLEDLGKGMVKRCAGLPLAIIVLGGILKKYSSQEWEKVSENVRSYLKRDKDKKVENVLALSFEELPYHLRPCFLYLSHFPEDYEIQVDRLIQLWIAEGFVLTELEEEVAEDIAEIYLVELVERFMIQVGEIDAATSKIRTCRMHDLMRDLCLLKAKHENFLHIMDSSSSNKLSSPTVRRIVANRFPDVGINNVRSIMFFENVSVAESKFQGSWEYICNNFKLIRVLHFEGSPRRRFSDLPRDTGNLIHLRFLSFKGLILDVDYFDLPSSLGNLTCLQTLDLRFYHSTYVYVPNVLWRLEQLEHLYLPTDWKRLEKHVWFKWSNKEEKLALHTLTKLQTLVNFNNEFCCATDLSQLISLRKLEISKCFFNIDRDFNKDSDGNPLIIKSKHLQSLSISFTGIIEPKDVALFLSSCPNLCKLSLIVAPIVKLPEYCHFSSNIAQIYLQYCHLEEDPMPTLGKLPNLRILILSWFSFDGKEMVCSPHAFPKLYSLILDELYELEEWKVDEGAMPALHHLSIHCCPKLKKIPDGLRFITTLQELKITVMSKEFKDKVEAGFQHVHSLIF